MGLVKDLLDLGSQALAGFEDNIPTLLAVIAVSAIVASRWQRSVDDGEIRGAKAENNSLKEQLNLARHDQKVVTKQSIKLESEIAGLRVEIASTKASLLPTVAIPQLDKVASTMAVLSDTVRILQAANSSLGSTLTGSGAPASAFKVASKSE